jgi:DNA-binding transcriptional MerR regulator
VDKGPEAFRTISEVADHLDLPQHVLRFWESRFAQIKPMKRGGGRRYYRPEDVDLLRGIRHLLYGEGYTIKGVQRVLKEKGVRAVMEIARSPEALKGWPLPDADDEDRTGSPDGDEPLPVGILADDAPVGDGVRARDDLSADDVKRLQAVLSSLLDCKRMLDHARDVEGAS